jgi:RNA-directed DNA polymerase
MDFGIPGANHERESPRTFARIFAPENLHEAFRRIGDKAAGPDGLTKATYQRELDDRLAALHRNLVAGEWKHSRAGLAKQPKKDGSFRPIVVMNLEDKIVQRALLAELGPHLEHSMEFSEWSFALTGRGVHAACDYVYQQLFLGGFEHWLKVDIANCYGSVPIEEICYHLDLHIQDCHVKRLLQEALEIETEEGRVASEAGEEVRGIAQGMPLSSVLVEAFLSQEFDQKLPKSLISKVVIARYVDDVLVGAADRETLEKVHEAMVSTLGSHSMALKEGKEEFFALTEDGATMEFLGQTFTRVDLPRGVGWSTTHIHFDD